MNAYDNLPRKMLNIKHFSLRFAIQNAIKVERQALNAFWYS